MTTPAQQQARTLIDFLSLPSQRAQHGAENCAFMQGALRFHLESCTVEENEPKLVEDVAAIVRILKGE